MNTIATENTSTSIETRMLREGYGPGAWHGPDLNAALGEIPPDAAFRRPAPGRHSIAEIALHHAYCVRSVRSRLTGDDAEPFVLEGDDWFELQDESRLHWSTILDLVRREHERLTDAVAEVQAGRKQSPLSETERFDLVLGIACHAIYHAGQIQLIKRFVLAT
jgi:uncharacterized damage-inducible protein DinB